MSIEIIMSELKVALADLDAKMTQNQKDWAKNRVNAVKAFKDAEHAKPRSERLNSYKYYDMLFALAGGKTWYNIFTGRNEQMINEFIEKNCEQIANLRNTKIARKLTEAGVVELVDQKAEHNSDGFNGWFQVETRDNGVKNVTITIYAGGYNVQCFHQRTLVKIK